jgi:preprotein translocase subunit SecD
MLVKAIQLRREASANSQDLDTLEALMLPMAISVDETRSKKPAIRNPIAGILASTNSLKIKKAAKVQDAEVLSHASEVRSGCAPSSTSTLAN